MARSEFPAMRIPRSRLGITSLVLLTLVRDALLQTPLRREDVAEGSCILPYPAASLPAPTFFLVRTLEMKPGRGVRAERALIRFVDF